MGQFSWLDCRNKRQIVDNKLADVFVLVPKEFGGGHIHEICYDGYGHFGGHDIYELVAKWNRNYINPNDYLKEPVRSSYSDDDYYYAAKDEYERNKNMLNDFTSNMSDEDLKEKYGKDGYGNDYLRTIGIMIACYDEDNARLKYPIKITHSKRAVYEDCDYSLGDPNQGWR